MIIAKIDHFLCNLIIHVILQSLPSTNNKVNITFISVKTHSHIFLAKKTTLLISVVVE